MRTQPYAKSAEDEPHMGGASPRPSAPPDSPDAAAVNSVRPLPSNRSQDRAREAEEDRALIAQAQGGDMGAFRRLVERHQRRAFSVAFGLVRDENDAREIVQDAFLRAFKSLPNFQGTSSFFTWLYRIITNLSIDLKRKPGRQTVDLDEGRLSSEDNADADFPTMGQYFRGDPSDDVRRGEIAKRLQTALDELPPYHRAVIVLREVEGLSYEEMARAMNVSKGTIMSRLFHARQKLQRALADCYAEQVTGGGLPGDDPGEEVDER